MCVDYTNLNKAFPEDAYPFPNTDRLVDRAYWFRLHKFLDAYSSYNEIKIYLPDQEKTTFITDRANFCYKVMPFCLKNAAATYQSPLDKLFKEKNRNNVEFYVDVTIMKSLYPN